VSWAAAPYEEEGRYHADTTCYRVEFECAKSGCRAHAQFHTVLNERHISTEAALLDKLRVGFFSGPCPIGHDLLPIPREKYRLDRVFDAIPSEA
jgi:hypothetical protein